MSGSPACAARGAPCAVSTWQPRTGAVHVWLSARPTNPGTWPEATIPPIPDVPPGSSRQQQAAQVPCSAEACLVATVDNPTVIPHGLAPSRTSIWRCSLGPSGAACTRAWATRGEQVFGLGCPAAAGLRDQAGNPLHVTLHQLRHTFGTTLANAGMSLPALMALMGHVTPEMTLRYARLASPTIRDAYNTAMAKANGRRSLFVIAADPNRSVPSKVDWLHAEMLKTRLAHGYCSRELVAGPCPYANICEQCDNFVPDPDRAQLLSEQLDDVRALRADANHRGWTDEAARHDRVANRIDRHLAGLRRQDAKR